MGFSAHSLAVSPRINPHTEEQDEQLLHAAKTGSHTAFEELQKLYARRLYKCTLSITKNPEDAEDALQDTFMRAYRGLPSFEGRCRLSSWLTRIAINSALMILRKRRSRPEISLEKPLDLEEELYSFDLSEKGLNPEQLCDQNQRCERIRGAIRKLDPSSQRIIFIRMSKENSMREIANELDLSVATAKTRLYRARKRLARSHPYRGSTLS